MQFDNGREGALAEIEFLARSSNRVTVLDALVDGPVGRYDLEEETGVSRATLGRILDDFTERGWVVEDDRRYEATALGAYVSRTFADILARFEPVPALNDIAQWLPEEGFDFDLGCLADADVVRPTRADALAPTNHIARRLRNANQVRLLTYAVLPTVMEACLRGAAEGTLELESVLERDAIDRFAADPAMVEQAQALFETGQAAVTVTDEDVSFPVFVVDDAVLLCLAGDRGAPQAVIETGNETVHTWADSLVETYRRDGDPLDPAIFTG